MTFSCNESLPQARASSVPRHPEELAPGAMPIAQLIRCPNAGTSYASVSDTQVAAPADHPSALNHHSTHVRPPALEPFVRATRIVCPRNPRQPSSLLSCTSYERCNALLASALHAKHLKQARRFLQPIIDVGSVSGGRVNYAIAGHSELGQKLQAISSKKPGVHGGFPLEGSMLICPRFLHLAANSLLDTVPV